jgi:L,D-transpeptidase ErfK/SrfK
MNNKVNFIKRSCLALTLGLFGVGMSSQANAAVFQYAPGQDVVGEIQQTSTVYRDSFVNLTQKYGVSYYELSEANPKVDPWVPGRGARIVVPTRFVLPAGKREGIVVDLSALRLYYFPANSNLVYTYPVGIGRTGWITPVGSTRVTEKIVNPSWRPPEAIRQEQAALGRALPEVVPAGPQNPLGTRAMRLALNGSYLIHGTNNPAGVGRRTSHGCIRMYEQDVAELFTMISVGTPVRIIHEPYKMGWMNGELYVQAHKPLSDSDYSRDFSLNSLRDMIVAHAGSTQANINWNAVRDVFAKADGIPTKVTGASNNRVATGGTGRSRTRQTSW